MSARRKSPPRSSSPAHQAGVGRGRPTLFVGLACLLVVTVALWPGFFQQAGASDEGLLLVYPEQLLKGRLPYRDFECLYGPGNLLALALAYGVAGVDIMVERTVGLLYLVAAFSALFVLISRWHPALAAGSVLLAALFFIPIGVGAYAFVGAIACALWSLERIAEARSRLPALLGGLLGGVAALYRPDFAPALLVSALPLFLTMSWPSRWRYLAGVGLGLSPYLFFLIKAGPAEVFNNLFLTPVFQVNPGRRLPLSEAGPAVARLFYLHIAAVIINLVAGVLAIRRSRQDPSARVLLGLALLGFGLSHQVVQRLDFAHVAVGAFLSVGLLPASLFVLRSFWVSDARPVADAVMTCSLAAVALMAIAPELVIRVRDLYSVPRSGSVTRQERSFPIQSAAIRTNLDELLKGVGRLSKPGQRLFVGPADLRRTNYNDTFLYYLLPELEPATYFLEMNPGSANRSDSRLAADLGTADWVILTHLWEKWNEPNASRELGSEAPMRVLEEKFEPVGKSDTHDLYVRKGLVPGN